jgi:hypothetical protein
MTYRGGGGRDWAQFRQDAYKTATTINRHLLFIGTDTAEMDFIAWVYTQSVIEIQNYSSIRTQFMSTDVEET